MTTTSPRAALACAALLALAATALPAAAQQRATANFALTGQIEAGTCTASSVAKTMPEVAANAFPQNASDSAGVPSSYTPFVLALTDCAGVIFITITMGTAADAEPTDTTVFRNKAVDAAPFTSIRLQRGTCSASGASRPGSTAALFLSAPDHLDVELCAQYHKLAGGLVTQGTISTDFTVTLVYH